MTDRFLPYGRQTIDETDIAAVIAVLKSDWLTTGPLVSRFEAAIAEACDVPHAAVVSSGTAALHAMMDAIGVSQGDEVIVPAITFAATANAVLYCGGIPVFADVDPDTLLISAASVAARIGPKTKAVVAVDYAGQPCDYAALRELTERAGVSLVADGCHSLGGADRHGRAVGSLADATVLSFHPVKHITSGEGGAVVSTNAALIDRVRIFRNHGITTDHRQREQLGSWFYEMTSLGYNYRLTDLQCALGLSQLARLEEWVARRRLLARHYDEALTGLPGIHPLQCRLNVRHAYHLYVVRVAGNGGDANRARLFSSLREKGIGANVHYIPVHLHPYYRERFGTRPGLCPQAEAAYSEILSLPLFPTMLESDVDRVVDVVREHLASSVAPSKHQ